MDLSAGFINMPGGSEWLVIFFIILVVFGPRNLPKIGQAIGRGIREFKDASEGITRTIEEEVAAAERKEQASQETTRSTPTSEPPHESSEQHTDHSGSD